MTARNWGQLVAILLALTMVVGWAINLYQLGLGCIEFTAASNYAFLMLRAVGVLVFPVGAILGVFF